MNPIRRLEVQLACVMLATVGAVALWWVVIWQMA
jgi:hypothetical protein